MEVRGKELHEQFFSTDKAASGKTGVWLQHWHLKKETGS